MASMSFEHSVKWIFSFTIAVILVAGNVSANKEGYYGKYIGKLSQLHHGVSGDVFAVDGRTLHLRNFNYDGEGPAAYFYAGNSKAPGVNGFRLRDERGTTNVLPRYRNKHITITLPEGKTLQNIRWFSVWCDEFSVNFGDVKIPKNLDFPKPQKISGLSGVHGVSSEPIVIVDAQTLLIPSFSYDGEAPDAKFWVGQGFKPSPQGIRIPDENGKVVPLRRYDRKTIVLTLPGDLTIFDIGHFGVWCEAFTVDFGHVQIPRGLNIPPSLKMLGVSPQSKLNCEVLWDDFAYEVRWAVAGDSIVLQLVARLENNEYMSFGLSGDYKRSRMVGGDVVVAWVDKESLKGYAQDYYLDAKSQCSGGRGSCPDENIALGTNSVRLLNAALVNGYSIVTLQRSLRAQDEFDKQVFTNESQPIIWAIGPLNSRKEVSYHSLTSRGDIFIDFGRSPKWNCPTPESTDDQSDSKESLGIYGSEVKEGTLHNTGKQDSGRVQSRQKIQIPTPAPASTVGAWEIPPIKCYEPEDGVFYAQMGPTGGKHGYSAITGHVGWGTSWYINGLLIPEINVVRGRTYTFIVEGGLDPEIPARYHPFYITDDPVGGYQYKTPEERANIQIFAGAVQNKKGEVRPTGVGRWCNWTPDPNQPPADEFLSFGAYQRTLRLECDPGNPGIIQWTVDKDTPDTVYYQCYTHRYLGWKINVHDHCEGEGASEPVPAIVKAPSHFINSHELDFEGSESINYETKIKPTYELFKNAFEKNQTKLELNQFINYKTDVKHYPQVEINKREPESSISGDFLGTMWKNEMRHKNPQLKPQELDELNSRSPQAFIYDSSVSAAQSPLPNIPRFSLFNDNKFIKFSQASQLPGTAWTDGEGAVYLNFHSEPATASLQGSQIELAYVDGSFKSGSKKEEGVINQAAPLIVQPLQKTKNSISVEEFRKNYHDLGAQTQEKLKKTYQKLPFPTQLSNNPHHNSQNFSPTTRLRKPSSYHALAQQQRPFSSEEFRPPSNKQSLMSTSQKIFHYTQTGKNPRPHYRPNIRYEPKDVYKHETQKNYQFSVPSQGNKKQQESVSKQDISSPLLLSGPFTRERQSLRNSGFDPESVKIEGGFKPILNTPVSKNNNLIDRFDQNIEDPTEILDLINRRNSDEKRFSTRQEEIETNVDKRDVNQPEPLKGEKIDLFKNQKPQMFEPIFIPSFPDVSLKKPQEKYKKTTFSSKKPNNELQNYNSPKKEEIYVKFRPTQNLVRRPFYPDNIIPPFKIPYHGGFPQLRHHETESLRENNGTFDIIEMSNETLPTNDSKAQNIFEVIEMYNDESQDSAIVSDSSTNTYFKDKNRSQSDDDAVVEDEIAMADNSRDYYLPPKSEEFLTYDGKLVKVELPPTILDVSPTADVSKLPQFVPFKGTMPPLSLTINTKNLAQLNSRNYARQDILPPTETKSTKLSAVQTAQHETTASVTQKPVVKDLLGLQEYEAKERKQSRRKRSPDHIPGHGEHDHHGHHPGVYSRSSSSTNINNLLQVILVGIVTLGKINNL